MVKTNHGDFKRNPWVFILPNFNKKFLFLSVQNFLPMLLSLIVPKGTICRWGGWKVRSGESSYLLILVYLFYLYCIKSFKILRYFCGSIFLIMLRTKYGNYIYFFIQAHHGQRNTLLFLAEVRENTSIFQLKS